MTDAEQALLTMTGKRRIDEHGESDQWGCGGVYDAAGKFDLDATEDLLADRFAPVRNRLSETVGEYERQPARNSYSTRYCREGAFEGRHGRTVSHREVRVFPVGPCLHQWTVSVEEQYPETDGWGSWFHSDATTCDDIGTAVATALAVMRGEVAVR